MKIAILTPTFNDWSGIDNVARMQAEDYAKNAKNKVTVITLQGSIKPEGYNIIRLGMPSNPFFQRLYRLFFFLDFNKLNQYKQLKNYDMIISHFYPMNWLAHRAKKRYGVNYIFWNHGIDRGDNFLQDVYMKLLLLLNKYTIENADKIVSVSDFSKEQLKEQTGLESDETKLNRIDKKRFNLSVKGDKVIKKYGLQDSIVYLYVGRITARKRVHLLIESFKSIKDKVPNAKLLIVGNPTFRHYKNKIKKIADDGVIFTGIVDYKELPSYYAACDFYVTASAWECYDLPIAEAQACGKRVIAFDIGSHKEVINKKKGILVPEENNKELNKKVLSDAMIYAYSINGSKRQFI